jgi:hypothetical protein
MKREKKIRAYAALILILILGLSISLYAEETRKETGKEKKETAASQPTVIQRTILHDDGIEIRYSDGTIKRIPKEEVEKKETRGQSTTENLDPMFPEASHPELFDTLTKEKYQAALSGVCLSYYKHRLNNALKQHINSLFNRVCTDKRNGVIRAL